MLNDVLNICAKFHRNPFTVHRVTGNTCYNTIQYNTWSA